MRIKLANLIWVGICSLMACSNRSESEHTTSVSQALEAGVVQPQVVQPITDQTTVAFDVNTGGVTPSATTPLPIGKRINVVSDLALLGSVGTPTPYIVQKITDRTYFIEIAFHSATAFVGNDGVLLIDAPNVVPSFFPGGPNDGDRLVQAVQSFTNKPITRLIYSHPHQDHVGSAAYLKNAFGTNGFKIVGTKWLKKAIKRYGFPLPEPDTVIKKRVATYQFENNPAFTFRIVTPESSAHTTADSYIITPDRVMHVVDFIHSRRLPFVENSVVMNQEGYIRMLRYLAGEQGNYDYINPGHENIAYFEDVQLTIDWNQSLYNKWWQLVQYPQNQFFAFADFAQDNSIVWLRNWFDALPQRMLVGYSGTNPPVSVTGVLEDSPYLNGIPYVEAGRDHASKVHEDLFLNRYSPTLGSNIPSFAPIAPPQSCADLDQDDCEEN